MKLVKEKGVSEKSDLNIAYNAGLVFSPFVWKNRHHNVSVGVVIFLLFYP